MILNDRYIGLHSAIVTINILHHFELLDFEKYRDLEI